MTDQRLNTAAFPAFKRSVRARWAPVLLEPIAGSYERLVIGVAVVSDDGFHLELANALDRLRCLYSDDAYGAVYAIQLTAEHLRQDLATRALQALTDPKPATSGVVIGESREAEGESLQKIGASWMLTLSSLYREVAQDADEAGPELDEALDGPGESGGDRLPLLVLGYVTERREGLARFFSNDLRGGRKRRTAGRSHEIVIDFSGSRLVANFGTLQAGSIAGSVNLIKRRLWDLKVERDREHSPMLLRQHEMILQAPPKGDPQVSTKQRANINDALEALEAQADQEELRLRALPSVAEIGEHLMRLEAA
ncbi:hypothetical protein CK222_21935 [Mesorhizobium sp. WSM3866]|uniref:hypothetical protein n=1 Tax=Mesorhizobium sp. WSM3866 TaxID=422271 RepID=UPI000BAFA920|nr:hypothetical protein [Mesorhizobium sp. WSM3866]PBB41816.1 hypothetical protein CK222_21935 [Mesorhizobium sp. WSM3866]